jgi:MFS family permease
MNMKKYYARLLLLAFASAIVYFPPYMYYTFGNQMMERYATDLPTLAGMVGIYGTIAFIVYIPAGVLVDIFSAKKLLIFSFLTTAILTVWLGFTGSVTMMRVIYVLMALTTILTFWSAWLVAVATAGGRKLQTRSFGLTYTMVGFTNIVVGMTMAGIIGNNPSNIGIALTVIAISMVVMAVLSMWLFDNQPSEDGEAVEESKFELKYLKEALTTPAVWYIGFMVFSFYALLATTNTFNQLLKVGYGMTDAQSSFIAVFRANGLGLVAGPAMIALSTKVKSTSKALRYIAIAEAILIAALWFLPTSMNLVIVAIIFVLAIAFCSLGARAIYFGTIGEANISGKILGTATGVISLVAYAADMFIHTLVANMITADNGDIMLSGFSKVHILQIALLAFGFVLNILIYKEAKKRNTQEA